MIVQKPTAIDLAQLQSELEPLVEAALARGEDLSTHQDRIDFVNRVMAQHGYVRCGDEWLLPADEITRRARWHT